MFRGHKPIRNTLVEIRCVRAERQGSGTRCTDPCLQALRLPNQASTAFSADEPRTERLNNLRHSLVRYVCPVSSDVLDRARATVEVRCVRGACESS